MCKLYASGIMSKKLLLFVFAIVIISGCTLPTSGKKAEFSTTQGAVIKQFAFDMPSILDDEQVGLTIKVENVGAKTMEGTTKVWLYGPAMSADGDGRKKWKIETSGTAEGGAYVWTLSSEKFYPPTEDGPGSVEVFTSTLTPPNLEENVEDVYTFNARMCYPYHTTSRSTLTSISRDEYRTTAPTDELAETKSSAGPIQIELQSKENIRIGAGNIPIVFVISNVGGGFSAEQGTCNVNLPSAKRNKLKFTVTVDGEATDCADKEVNVRTGQATVYCNYKFTSDVPSSEYHIVAKAEYDYYVTQETSIKVKDSFVPEADE